MSDREIARYYDRLSRWNRLARLIGYGGGSERLTVHRALADPAAGGRATTSRLHDLILSHLPPDLLARPVLRVLDAGCGIGGTMLFLADCLGARATGLTLSPTQADVARAAIVRRGRSELVDVLVRSYDRPPAGPFDLVIAVESFAHSVAPETSLAAVARVLAPRGTIVVVDDMPEAAAEGTRELDTFKRGWQAPVLWSRTRYLEALASLDFEVVHDLDLTADVRPRPLSRIAVLEAANRIAYRLLPFAGIRRVMDSHLGGLALERMCRRRSMRYRMLVATRRRAESAGADLAPRTPDRELNTSGIV